MNEKKLAHYTILEKLGAGGMGEVYRAEDTKLGRQVAIKVLPEVFVDDKERMARFEREAKMLASLNHPNIAAIYGLEEAEGKSFLVMELVEGETLAQKLEKGALSIEDSLDVCLQITEAIEAAHAKDIIHRDLKPANVKVTPEGKVKILDFGLAKAQLEEETGSDLIDSPTLTAQMTQPGVILGTAPYMSPEQAKGKTVDKRTDIWAFGCILYECLTGLRAFKGETVSETMASILKGEPDWNELSHNLPKDCLRLLNRCLRKDLNRRLQSIGDARVDLIDLTDQNLKDSDFAALQETSKDTKSPLRKYALFAVIAVGAALLGIFFSWIFLNSEKPKDPLKVVRFFIDLPTPQHVFTDCDTQRLIISRDGSKLVWIGKNNSKYCLYTRKMNDLEPKIITGTEGVDSSSNIFLSPDGSRAGFIREGDILTIPIEGGIATTVFKSEKEGDVWQADWGDDGSIVFTYPGTGLQRLSPGGTAPEEITFLNPEKKEASHSWVRMLPGGHGLLFSVCTGNYNDAHIEAFSFKTGKRKKLPIESFKAQYVFSGHLLYNRDNIIYAVPFDLQRLEVIGPEVPVLQDVQLDSSLGRIADYSISQNGTLVYIPADQGFGERKMIWLDRQQNIQELEVQPGFLSSPKISPDGKKIAYGYRQGHVTHLKVYDLNRSMETRVTSKGSTNSIPVWSPDSSTLAFLSNRNGQYNLFAKSIEEDSEALHLLPSRNLQWPTSWTSYKNSLAYVERGFGDQQLDVWILPMSQSSFDSSLFLNSKSFETQARFSPDGKWIAYVSDEDGKLDVFIRKSPMAENPSSDKQKVSRRGGFEPVWAKNGSELFYRSLDGRQIISIEVRLQPNLSFGQEQIIMDNLNLPTFSPLLSEVGYYDVSPDGEKILITVEKNQPETMKLLVVLNWLEELKKKVSSKIRR